MKGKAVVFPDMNKVELRLVDIPEPSEEDVVIDVECSWISIGTESSYLRGERIAGEQRYIEGGPWPFPHVPGYQKVGIVKSIGSKVSKVSVGDRVFASVSKVSNMFFDEAGHISPAVTHENQVWKLPGGSIAEDYAGLVLTQVGYNCGMRPEFNSGDMTVVIGDGLVGQWAAQTLLHREGSVIVLGRHDERLSFLPSNIKSFNTKKIPLPDILSQFEAIKVVIDTVGDMETVSMLQPKMAHNSHLVSAGFLGEKGLVDIQTLRDQEITLHTPSGWQKERMDHTLLGIKEGWLKTSTLITDRFPIDKADEAWRYIIETKSNVLGVLLEW